MANISALESELCELAHPEGGWGYTANQPPTIEPTCLALLALSSDLGAQQLSATGFQRLASCRRPDGSYRNPNIRDEAVWGTSLALMLLHDRFQKSQLMNKLADSNSQLAQVANDPNAPDRNSLDATASFLLGVRGRPGQEDPETDTAFDIDIRLVGWPWAEGTFSWVEPTAWACLALQKCGQGAHPRVQDGIKVLINRAFDTGGMNYGNKRVLQKSTEPIPGPSAIALLALQHFGHEPRVQATRDYIRLDAQRSNDVEHLSLTKLALAAHGETGLGWLDERIHEAIQLHLTTPWASKSPTKIALALLALDCDRHHPFRLESSKGDSPLPEKPSAPTKKALGERIKFGFKSLIARGLDRMRQPPPKSVVHIARAKSYDDDLVGVVKRQFESFRALVPISGKRVVLKPNLVEYHRDKVINTHPRVIDAVIQLCKDEGAAEVIVAEGPGHWRNVQYLVAESGLGDVLQKHDVKFVDLNHDEPVKLLNLGRLTGLEHLFLAKTVAEAEVLISMPKLKTHHWAGATLSLKNLFGTLPGTCYGWPKNELHWRGIAESIIDIALTCTPHLALVDGVIGMEGDGPLNGTARPVGALIMGNDLVATDATCCRLMGLPPERIVHVALGAHKRLGRIKADEIELVGEKIEHLMQQFEPPPRFEKITLPVEKAATC